MSKNTKAGLDNFLDKACDFYYIPPRVYMTPERKKVYDRLKRIEGQIRGLQRLIEKDAPCIDILTQVAAVTSAIKKTGSAVLSNYMKTCIEESGGNTKKLHTDLHAALSRVIDLS